MFIFDDFFSANGAWKSEAGVKTSSTKEEKVRVWSFKYIGIHVNHQTGWLCLHLNFNALGLNDQGHIVFVLFLCLSVVNLNLCYGLWTEQDRDFIFGMHTELMMPFQMTPRSITSLKIGGFFYLVVARGIVFHKHILFSIKLGIFVLSDVNKKCCNSCIYMYII